jgi:hypothetical protein
MKIELKIRRFIRQTLNESVFELHESTESVSMEESDNIIGDIVRSEEIKAIQNGEDSIDENCLDDRKPQGADKILAKSNDKVVP